jgi:large subunit ribosomal protein L32e
MARLKFLRRNTTKLLRLGKKRKKLQKWRAPTGRDNKMRLRERGYPRTVEVGFKKDKKVRGTIEGKNQKFVENLKDINNVKKNEIVILKKIGMKKKIAIAKKAQEKGIKIKNLNVNKFLNNLGDKK